MDFLRGQHPWRNVLFAIFVLAILLVFTGVWQLAFLAGYVGGFLGKRPRRDFALGFLGTALAWAGHILWVYVTAPAGRIAELFVQILGLGAGAAVIVPILALLIGGLAGGLGALLGAYAGQLAYRPKAGWEAAAEPPH
ncbi:MAG: hypothetical protein HY557_05340 [Euryarchaeota archaeon]|nr:hypothetical protein [Euryarchaeota archaeon]